LKTTGRSAFLAAVLAASSAGLAGQEAEYFEPPPARPHFTFRWDFLARYDRISHLRVRPDIERGRFELRPELGFELSDRFRVATRAVLDLGTDANEENGPNFDNYHSRGASLDRWYVEARPGRFVVRAGRFGMPLASSELLWDRDLQPPGAAVAWETPSGGGSALVFAAAAFRGAQREGDRTRIAAGQLLWRYGDEARFAVEASAAYWHFEPDRLKPHFFRQNYFVPSDGGRRFVSRFRLGDVLVRLRFPVGRMPATVSLDGIRNFGARGVGEDDADAFEGTLALGRVGTPGQWRFFYTYQYVERDAVLGAFNTDDWWFHSWYRGHRTGVAFTILPSVFLQGTLTFQRRLDLKGTLNRVMVEMVKIF
jgi:hypothetical protein